MQDVRDQGSEEDCRNTLKKNAHVRGNHMSNFQSDFLLIFQQQKMNHGQLLNTHVHVISLFIIVCALVKVSSISNI